MNKFLVPTKAKFFLTIGLLVLYFFINVVISFYTLDIGGIPCMTLPRINSDGKYIMPTPVPLNAQDTISDFTSVVTGKMHPCTSFVDPSYIVASQIYIVSWFILIMFAAYLVSCIIIISLTKLKRQRESYSAKTKK